MCPEGAGAGALPERDAAQVAAAEAATFGPQCKAATERLAALRATPDGRRLLAASEEPQEHDGEPGEGIDT